MRATIHNDREENKLNISSSIGGVNNIQREGSN